MQPRPMIYDLSLSCRWFVLLYKVSQFYYWLDRFKSLIHHVGCIVGPFQTTLCCEIRIKFQQQTLMRFIGIFTYYN